MTPAVCSLVRGFAGFAFRLAAERAATFFLAALLFAARFGIARFAALAFFAFLAGFLLVVLRTLDFFAFLRLVFFANVYSRSASYASFGTP